MHLVIVIPAYNEAKVIGQVIDNLPKQLKKITKITTLVVDDNSQDNTSSIARAHGAKCLRHEINLGAGGATATGLEAAKLMKADLVVTLDADGQHDPADIAAVIRPITHKNIDFVLGSRLRRSGNRSGKGMPPYKRVGNFLLNLVTFIFFGIWVTDSQSGFKAFSKHALHTIQVSTDGYEFCSEIIGEVKRHKLSYKEVPINTIYTDYSKIKGQPALNAINIFINLLIRGIR